MFPKKCFKNRSTSLQNIEVDSDSEPDFTPQPEQEEPELEEVTAADDLSMLDRLHQGGLAHVDANEPQSPSLIIVMMMIMHLLMILIEIISSVR